MLTLMDHLLIRRTAVDEWRTLCSSFVLFNHLWAALQGLEEASRSSCTSGFDMLSAFTDEIDTMIAQNEWGEDNMSTDTYPISLAIFKPSELKNLCTCLCLYFYN
uniref:Uncharacterized protein n=1 Tax=Lymantria dispar multicapsid nuclear polyhedrosis virus TaxID=10449 RepID=A0A1B1MQQ1_NPVLD|nr:hypothetical protein [Lymantria dispar multiple nucleopolyhedrovirus]